jgi:hypothetical protein
MSGSLVWFPAIRATPHQTRQEPGRFTGFAFQRVGSEQVPVAAAAGEQDAQPVVEHVDHDAPGDIADRADPPSRPAPPGCQPLGLVHPDCLGDPDAVEVLDQRLAPVGDRVHHGVPRDSELGRRVGDGVDLGADLPGRPLHRPAGHRSPGRGDVRDKTPRCRPLDDSESAGVMPQTLRGRHVSCSCASQTSVARRRDESEPGKQLELAVDRHVPQSCQWLRKVCPEARQPRHPAKRRSTGF